MGSRQKLKKAAQDESLRGLFTGPASPAAL